MFNRSSIVSVYMCDGSRDVTVHRLVAAGTVEEQILELHKKKETINRGALGGGNDKRTEAGKVERTDRPRGGEGQLPMYLVLNF